MAIAKSGTVNTVLTPAQSALNGAMQTSTPAMFSQPSTSTPKPAPTLSISDFQLGANGKVPSSTSSIPTTGFATNINKNIGSTPMQSAPNHDQMVATLQQQIADTQQKLTAAQAAKATSQQTPNYSLGNGRGSIVPDANYTPSTNIGDSGTYQTDTSQLTPAPAAGIIANPPPIPTYSGLIGQLAQTAAGQAPANPLVTQTAQQIADLQKKGADLQNTAAINEETQQGQGLLPSALGRAQQIATTAAAGQNALATQEGALGTQLQNELSGQQQQITGLTSAASLAQPSTASYGQTIFDPLTQSFKSNGSGNLDPQTLANQLAPLVASGQMTIDAANAQMTGGVAGTTALRQAILAANPNFNFNLSSASGATQQQGQQISAAIPPANQALDALQTSFNNLSGLQQGNIPIIGNVPLLSQLIQGASMNFGPGRDAASAYQGALNEARSRIDGALAGVIGVDAASKQATALLPDNMLPSEIPQKIAAAKQYLQNQLNSYTGSGQQNNSGGSSNGSVSAGGFDFVQDANGNWIAK